MTVQEGGQWDAGVPGGGFCGSRAWETLVEELTRMTSELRGDPGPCWRFVGSRHVAGLAGASMQLRPRDAGLEGEPWGLIRWMGFLSSRFWQTSQRQCSPNPGSAESSL